MPVLPATVVHGIASLAGNSVARHCQSCRQQWCTALPVLPATVVHGIASLAGNSGARHCQSCRQQWCTALSVLPATVVHGIATVHRQKSIAKTALCFAKHSDMKKNRVCKNGGIHPRILSPGNDSKCGQFHTPAWP